MNSKPVASSLTKTHPHIAEQWSATNTFGPETVSAGSHKKAEFVCSRHGHMSTFVVRDYVRHQRCTGCESVAFKSPELLAEWDDEADPWVVSAGSNKKVQWKCSRHGHTWQSAPSSRNRHGNPNGCSYCSNKKVLAGYNDLASTHPEIVPEWSSSPMK